MKIAPILLLTVFSLFLEGCQSVESQKQMFRDHFNWEIGRPFLAIEKRDMKEIKLSDTLSEFVPETIPSDSAVVAWMVDTSRRGSWVHPTNGETFQIEGIKKSWRLLGDPEKARIKIVYWPPM